MANTKKYVSLDKLGLYDEKIKKVITDGDAATLDAAKGYADGLAVNYDAAGAAATAEANAKSYTDAEVAKANEAAADADAKAAQGVADAATAQAAADKAQGDVDTLKTYVGTIPETATATDVIGYVQEKTAGIATSENLLELTNRVAAVETNKADKTQVATDIANAVKVETDARVEAVQAVQDAVDELAGTHGTDKAALEAAIALKADKTALDGVSAVANAAATKEEFDAAVEALEGEDTRIEGLVTAEAAKAREEEGKLDARLDKVEAFFVTKDAEGNDVELDAALDTLVEIQKYITEDGSAADKMVEDIAANKKAIEDHMATNHDFATADATLKAELTTEIGKKADKTTVEGIDGRLTTAEGKITTVEGKVSTLEGKMTTVEGAVATKAEKTEVEAADKALSDRLDVIEGKFDEGEGSVEDMIADAVAAERALIDAELEKKVDKVDGKGLSTNDLTNELKANYDAAYTHSTVAHAPANAQENKIETVKVNGTAVTITDKAVDIAVPTDNAQLTNGAGYLVANDIANKADKATTLAGYGIDNAYTKSETDTAIANAVGQFVEVSEEEINALFD